MRGWRWVLVALLVVASLVFAVPLLTDRSALACRPEMALDAGMLDGLDAVPGRLKALTGTRAAWQAVGPATPDEWHFASLGTGGGGARYPWTASAARALCVTGMPCAMKLGTGERFAMLWAAPRDGSYIGELIVQDGPRRRVHLISGAEQTPEGATCAALGAWYAFERAELPGKK